MRSKGSSSPIVREKVMHRKVTNIVQIVKIVRLERKGEKDRDSMCVLCLCVVKEQRKRVFKVGG